MFSLFDVNFNVNLDVPKLMKYLENLFKEKKPINILRNTSREIFSNLSFFNVYDFKGIKSLPINSPKVKDILNKSISTKFCKQFLEYSDKIKGIKANDKKEIIKNIELVLHKINEMRKYSRMSDKELKKYKTFRPLSRFSHILKVYKEIRKSFR